MSIPLNNTLYLACVVTDWEKNDWKTKPNRNKRTKNETIILLEQLQNTPFKSRGGGKGLASTRQVSSVAGSLNEAISYVLATRLRVATRQN